MPPKAPDKNQLGAGPYFVACCYEILLGRDIDFVSVLTERGQGPATQVVETFLKSDEFDKNVYQRVRSGQALEGLYNAPLLARHRYWAAENLQLTPETVIEVTYAKSWREMLCFLLADEDLMALGSRAALEITTAVNTPAPEDGPEIFAVSAIPFDPRHYPLKLRDVNSYWN